MPSLTNYTGNAGLGQGSNADIPVISDESRSLNLINDTANRMMLANHQNNVLLFQQKIADRDELYNQLHKGQITVGDIEPKDRPAWEEAKKVQTDAFYNMAQNGGITNKDAYRKYTEATTALNETATHLQARKIGLDQYKADIAKEPIKAKRDEIIDQYKGQLEKPSSALIDPYQRSLDFDADKLLSVGQAGATIGSGVPQTVTSQSVRTKETPGKPTVTTTFQKTAPITAKGKATQGITTVQTGQSQPTGLIEEGNIDLEKQPSVKNPFVGGKSTVWSMSIGTDKGEVLISRVTPQGKVMTEKEAIDYYKKTGKHLGVFNSPDAATQYAKQLHNDYESGKIKSKGQDDIAQTIPQSNIVYRNGLPYSISRQNVDFNKIKQNYNDSYLDKTGEGTELQNQFYDKFTDPNIMSHNEIKPTYDLMVKRAEEYNRARGFTPLPDGSMSAQDLANGAADTKKLINAFNVPPDPQTGKRNINMSKPELASYFALAHMGNYATESETPLEFEAKYGVTPKDRFESEQKLKIERENRASAERINANTQKGENYRKSLDLIGKGWALDEKGKLQPPNGTVANGGIIPYWQNYIVPQIKAISNDIKTKKIKGGWFSKDKTEILPDDYTGDIPITPDKISGLSVALFGEGEGAKKPVISSKSSINLRMLKGEPVGVVIDGVFYDQNDVNSKATKMNNKSVTNKQDANIFDGTTSKSKKVSPNTIKSLVGQKGYEGYTEKELIDYYKSNGYEIK